MSEMVEVSAAELATLRKSMALLDKLWTDLNHECEEFGKQATVPETLLKTLDLVNEVREGKLSPNVLEEKSKLLQSLLAESYHLPESIISRIIPGDAWFKVRAYLGKQKNWTEQQINATVDSLRRKHPDAAGDAEVNDVRADVEIAGASQSKPLVSERGTLAGGV